MVEDMEMAVEAEFAKIITANKKPVNFRKKANRHADLVPRVPEIPYGAIVEVNYTQGDWSHVTYNGYDGFVMSEFLGSVDTNTKPDMDVADFVDDTLGSIEEKAALYRVYIDFTNKKDALAFQAAMKGCQVGSVK